MILCDGVLVTSEHLPITVSARPATPVGPEAPQSPDTFPSRGVNLGAIERDLVIKALANARHNKSLAAKLLGVPRGQFYSLLRRHGLTEARR